MWPTDRFDRLTMKKNCRSFRFLVSFVKLKFQEQIFFFSIWFRAKIIKWNEMKWRCGDKNTRRKIISFNQASNDEKKNGHADHSHWSLMMMVVVVVTIWKLYSLYDIWSIGWNECGFLVNFLLQKHFTHWNMLGSFIFVQFL